MKIKKWPMKRTNNIFFCWAIIFLVVFASAGSTAEAYTEQFKKVLVLNSFHQGFAWTDNVMAGIRSVFDKEGSDIELTVEYMDLYRHDSGKLFPILEQLYKEKLGQPFDAVVVSDDSGLEFLLSRRDVLLPDTPIIFCGINKFTDTLKNNHYGITGVLEDIDLAGNIDLILQLHPSTKRIAVISDATEAGKYYLKRLQRIEPHFKGVVEFTELNNFTTEEMRTVLRNLPDDTVILLLSVNFDRTGRMTSQKQSVDFITENSKLPM